MTELETIKVMKKLRGLVHFKKSAQQIKDEMREGWQ